MFGDSNGFRNRLFGINIPRDHHAAAFMIQSVVGASPPHNAIG